MLKLINSLYSLLIDLEFSSTEHGVGTLGIPQLLFFAK